MSIIKCPECQQPVSTMAGTCPHCGTPIAGNITKCPSCQNFILKEQEVCPHCGKAIQTPAEPQVATAQTKPAAATPPQQKPKKRSYGCLKSMIAFLLVAAIAGAGGWYWYQRRTEQREAADYALLENVTNPQFYEQFLTDHPNSIYCENVRRRREKLLQETAEWEAVARSRSRIEILKFLQAHPKSVRQRECNDMLDSIDWNDALSIGTLEAMSNYLSNHPNGLYAAEASEQMNELGRSRISPEERSIIYGVLDAFFTQGMARQDTATISRLTQDVRFCGTPSATPQQVLQFMQSKQAADVIGLHYLVNTDLNLRRETLEDGKLGFAVDFSLEETLSRTDANQPNCHTYRVSAQLNAERRIVQMNIR